MGNCFGELPVYFLPKITMLCIDEGGRDFTKDKQLVLCVGSKVKSSNGYLLGTCSGLNSPPCTLWAHTGILIPCMYTGISALLPVYLHCRPYYAYTGIMYTSISAL